MSTPAPAYLSEREGSAQARGAGARDKLLRLEGLSAAEAARRLP